MRVLPAQVGRWQDEQRLAAHDEGYVCTILGRRRLLPDASGGGAAKVRTPDLYPSSGCLL